jgi:hypothetical protein
VQLFSTIRVPFAFLRVSLVAAVLSSGAALSVAPSAAAQFGGRGGMAQLFMPEYLSRDLPVFVDSLQLEEWQRPILEALLDDYNTNFNTAADGVRQAISGLKDAAAGTSPDKVIELVQQPLLRWADEKEKLRQDFIDNVKSQLSDTQAELWPKLDRAMRREKCLPNHELSGEGLNLLLILRELEVSPAAADAAREAVEAYEANLDTALAAREQIMQSAIAGQLRAMSNPDPEAGVQLAEQIMARRVAVRTVQDESLAAIRDALGAEYGATFERRALQRAFPQVYRPDPITPLFEAANALPDLTDDQKTSLKALSDRFNAEYPAFQKKFADGYRLTEPREPRRRTELARNRGAGNSKYGEAPEIEALKAERDAMFARFREEIAAILNDAQKQAIPGMEKPGVDNGDPTPVGTDRNVLGPDAGKPAAPGGEEVPGTAEANEAIGPAPKIAPSRPTNGNDSVGSNPKEKLGSGKGGKKGG